MRRAALPALSIEFCDERVLVDRDPFSIGRDADLVIDVNPYLHRRLATVSARSGSWVLANVGARLALAVSGPNGAMSATLAPGASIGLVEPITTVGCVAGKASYEFEIVLDAKRFDPHGGHDDDGGDPTLGPPPITPEQLLLLVALAEPALRQGIAGPARVPSSYAAATRLGWTMSRFNRQLDRLCARLLTTGVRGLHGGPGAKASRRRELLVEHAIHSGLVGPHDLHLLVPGAGPDRECGDADARVRR